MRHEYIQLSQRDPRWSSIFLGTSSSVTLGEAGCFLVSFCVLSQYYGHSILPPELNTKFVENNLFTSGDLVSKDNDLSVIFPDISYTTSYYFPDVPPTPANLLQLRDLLSDPSTCVIVQIDLGNGSSHFTPVIDCDGSTVTLMNVWNGQEQNFKDVYGDPSTRILKYVVYRGNPISLDPLVCDRKSVRDSIVGKASQWDDIVNHGFSSPQAVYERIQSLLDQINTLQIQLVKSQQVQISVPGTTIPTVATTAIPQQTPPKPGKTTGFWQTDIADLFKLFTKGGNK